VTFDSTRYYEEVIRPLRGRHGPVEVDLIRRYAIEPGLTGEELRDRIGRVRRYWNQFAGFDHDFTAQVCQRFAVADEELRRQHGDGMYEPRWWAEQARQRAVDSLDAFRQLAEELRTVPLGRISPDQLQAMGEAWPVLTPEQLLDAARTAGCQVVDPMPLPTSSGLAPVDHRQLTSLLDKLNLPTVIALLLPDLDRRPFRLLYGFEVPGAPALRLDRSTVEREMARAESAADAPVVRIRKDALRLLRGTGAPTDLAGLALFQIVEGLRAKRASRVPENTMVQSVVGLGLDPAEAALLVFSLREERGPAASPLAARIRTLVGSGELRAAREALADLPAADPDRAELGTLIDQQVASTSDLVRQARAVAADGSVRSAEALLTDAAQLSRDDPEIADLLAQLPLGPPADLVLSMVGDEVSLTWSPPDSSADHITYVVVRGEGTGGPSAVDGDTLGRTAATSWVDSTPPAARELRYDVSARRAENAPWSPAASATVFLLPPVSDVRIIHRGETIAASWERHPSAEKVAVRRCVGHWPADPGDGAPLADSTATSFVDRELSDEPVYYSFVVEYAGSDGRRLRSKMTVYAAPPPMPVSHVKELTAVVTPGVDEQTMRVRLRWPTMLNADVMIRWAGQAPSWTVGATLPLADVERYGQPLTGVRSDVDDVSIVDAELPVGQYVCVPVAVGGQYGLVGAPVAVGPSSPVGPIEYLRLGHEVRVSWPWPAGVNLADVEWITPGYPPVNHRVTRRAYATGVSFPIGIGGATVSVRAVAVGPLGETPAEPVTLQIPGRPIDVYYRFLRPAAFSVVRWVPGQRAAAARQAAQEWHVELQAEADCTGVGVTVVAGLGPNHLQRQREGVVVAEHAGIDLLAGQPVQFPFTLDSGVSAQWLQCFPHDPATVAMIDPPVENMRLRRR
jgi:hypothetical protein